MFKNLKYLGMQQGGLSGTIPTEIGTLTNLSILDFDFNQLTGTLPTELISLSKLTQFDVNDNKLSGSISVVGGLGLGMNFISLHKNAFTGVVPDAIGAYTNLKTFTVHQTQICGKMPESVCKLFELRLEHLIYNCNDQCTVPYARCTDCDYLSESATEEDQGLLTVNKAVTEENKELSTAAKVAIVAGILVCLISATFCFCHGWLCCDRSEVKAKGVGDKSRDEFTVTSESPSHV